MMRSKKILLIIFLTLVVFSLSACGFFKQVSCEHVWEETVETAATCTKDGTMLKTCTLCGKKMHEKIPAGGHLYEETERVDAKCTTSGHVEMTCKYCGDKKTETLDPLGHNIQNGITVNPTCTEDGYTEGVCARCREVTRTTIPATGHSFGPWVIITPATNASTGLQRRTCKNCDATEEEIIPIIDYIDLDLLEYGLAVQTNYDASSEDELAMIYSTAILNRLPKVVVDVKFSYSNFNEMFDSVKEKQTVNTTYNASATMVGSTLTINFTYPNLPSKTTTSEHRYEQYASLNAYKATPKRANNYDDFKINSASLIYEVSTSSQLVYVLERAAKPVPKSGSTAETLYNKAKAILREIINDDMNDYEKVRAIHDYLVMNVTYDDALYDLLYEGATDLKEYNGFYLEGVFNDKIAVCEGISAAFVVLANIEGIPAVQVTGYSALNPNGAGHAWNKVCVGEKWYIIDCTSDGTIISNTYEILSYEYFLISENTYENSTNKYHANNFKNIICTDDYDPYTNFKYDNTHTFTVNSSLELKEVVQALHNMTDAKKTCQIKFNYPVIGSKSSEINKAYQLNHIETSFSYVENGDIVTIIEG
ncbi:MAG: transglutaminase domain-containing protein [Bacilli bacterium]|nr:transglutaminase domain-containing protein [Bacilli bacterium]